jgi:hypothetical protein
MKKLIIVLIALLVAVAAFSQKSETRSLSSFSTISAHEGITVYLKKGDKEEARVSTEKIELSKVLTEVSGGKLKIHIDGNNNQGGKVQVWVTYKAINGVSASSAASVKGENTIETSGMFTLDVSSAADVDLNIKSGALTVSASSSGDADLNVVTGDIKSDVSSAGRINLIGNAKGLKGSASSAGSLDAYGLVTESASLSASSGASIKVNASESLDAKASSGGSIRYQGAPKKVNIESTSGGSVKKAG